MRPELIEQLEPLRRLASERATLLIATREGGPAALGVPPLFEALRVRRLAVGRLKTLHQDLGVLFAGREAGRPFSPGEELALLAIAQQAAVGIENLRLTSCGYGTRRVWSNRTRRFLPRPARGSTGSTPKA